MDEMPGRPIYTDGGAGDHGGHDQAEWQYVREAEDEFDGQEVTWLEVHERAWELQHRDYPEGAVPVDDDY